MNTDGKSDPTAPAQAPLVRGVEPFDAFYRRERRSIVGLAYVLSHSRLAAEDLAQDAFTAAYRRWEEVNDRLTAATEELKRSLNSVPEPEFRIVKATQRSYEKQDQP